MLSEFTDKVEEGKNYPRSVSTNTSRASKMKASKKGSNMWVRLQYFCWSHQAWGCRKKSHYIFVFDWLWLTSMISFFQINRSMLSELTDITGTFSNLDIWSNRHRVDVYAIFVKNKYNEIGLKPKYCNYWKYDCERLLYVGDSLCSSYCRLQIKFNFCILWFTFISVSVF